MAEWHVSRVGMQTIDISTALYKFEQTEPKMKYKVMCNEIPMSMNRSEDDKYYETDSYLCFDNRPGMEFSSLLAATRAVERSIIYAIEHGYEKSWGIFMGYSVVPTDLGDG